MEKVCRRDVSPHGSAPGPGEAGFSVIEGLIAAALLLIITVGVLPLFSRSMVNNVKGNDATRQSNGAVTELERSVALPFLSGDLTVAPGEVDSVVQTAIGVVHLPDNQKTFSPAWVDFASLAPADVVMRRTRTLEQYSFDDYRLDQTFDDPLPGEAEQRLVHLKMIELVFEEPLDPLGVRWKTHYTVRAVQAY
jgi:hypothetical protein